MLKERARLINLVVFSLDLLLVALAFVLAHTIRGELLPDLGWGGGGEFYPLGSYLGLLPLALVLWAAWLWGSGRYRSHRTVSLPQEVGALLRVGFLASGLFALLVWGLRLDERLLDSDRLSRAWLLLFSILATSFIVAEKIALRALARWVRQRGWNYRTVAIVGTGRSAQLLARAIRSRPSWGYRFLGFLESEPEEERPLARHPRPAPILGRAEELPQLVTQTVVDEVLFAVPPRDLARFEHLVLSLQEVGVVTRLALDFLPHAHARVELESLEGIPLVSFATAPTGAFELALKRIVDFTVAVVVLVLSVPVLLGVALSIRLTSRGSILFRQVRCGLNGRRFVLYKFRTMVEDAEARLEEVAHLNHMNGPVFKARNDPRVTAIGRFLRRFSLDELPQLWNVIRGDMSLVGPRPPIPEEVAQYTPWQRRRLAMKPGLTGLWQISGRNELDFDRWMELDLEYIDTWSPWLDFKILLKTIPAVLSGRGAS